MCHFVSSCKWLKIDYSGFQLKSQNDCYLRNILWPVSNKDADIGFMPIFTEIWYYDGYIKIYIFCNIFSYFFLNEHIFITRYLFSVFFMYKFYFKCTFAAHTLVILNANIFRYFFSFLNPIWQDFRILRFGKLDNQSEVALTWSP